MENLTCRLEITEIEKHVMEQIGIPSLVLMEKAAGAVADEICRKWTEKGRKDTARVLILAGSGNNGADALALARMLSLIPSEDDRNHKRFQVTVLTRTEAKKSAEYITQEKWLSHYDVTIVSQFPEQEYDIYVDGIFGFGLNREVGGEYADWIRMVNAKEGLKVAIDLPSGIHADTGMVLGTAFKAEVTVTFSYRKPGQIFYPGREYCGEVIVKGLDFPENVVEQVISGTRYITMNPKDVRLPQRKRSGHKGTFGKVLVVGGFENMPGAAIMSLRGALHCGCGMIRVCSQQKNRDLILQMVPEAQFSSVEELPDILDWPDVIVIGPGLGTGEDAVECLKTVLTGSKAKYIICDADALNLLSGICNELWSVIDCKRECEIILTPHIGELSRLLSVPAKELSSPAETYSQEFAEKHEVILVKKDAATCVFAKGQPVYVNSTGNSGMGTGGSGDVLTGILAGLLAQNEENTYNTVCLSVCVHGMAGDEAARKSSEYSVAAGSMIDEIESVIKVISDCTK